MEQSGFRAGSYKQRYEYKSFSPALINKGFHWSDRRIDILLEEAGACLGELNASSLYVPDVDFFIQMHVIKEATTSSAIEGTRTEVADAVMPEEAIEPEKRDDWLEVGNYTRAMNFAIKEMEDLPLSMRLLRAAHKRLLDGTRGEHKMLGEVRTSQNWIGGSSLRDAAFIPPHHEELPELLSDLEKFWHNADLNIPHLIKNAISHYQFETIHPFLDGNGRIGRLLITLHMINSGLISKPTLYLSDFLQKNKGAYFDSLTAVRCSNDIEQWIRFFLNGVATTARQGSKTLQNIVALRQDCQGRLLKLGSRARKGQELLNLLFSRPYVSAQDVGKEINLSLPAVYKLLGDFERLGIVQEATGQKRNRYYYFRDYVALFQK